MSQQRKAVSLISGGLDSMLATKVILEQGIHVEGINFYTGFCVEGHTHAIRQKDQKKQKRNNALWVAEQLGIKLHIIDIVEDYKDVVINPKHGYGQNLNPCFDCKIFMADRAMKWAEAHGFDFLITGEVVGQRPMSQVKWRMQAVSAQSGAKDRLLRPLSAHNLEPTLPEREGWVDREKLFGFSGRSRKPQIALAESLGIDDYAQPAGGCCFLTDEKFSKKLQDMWTHRGTKRYEFDDIMLLKVGRHLRLPSGLKMIIGREEGENNYLHGYRREFLHMYSESHEGPLVLIEGENPSETDLLQAARIVARYGKGKNSDQVSVNIVPISEAARTVDVVPMPIDEIPSEWMV